MGVIKSTNTRLTLVVPKNLVWELKLKATKNKMSISEFMVAAALKYKTWRINP